MKGFVSAVALITVLSSVANADGFPQRNREPVCCAPFSWTGVYVGAHAGWGSLELLVPGNTQVPSPTGGLWGGQIGANYQFARNWVVGAEIDSALARVEDTQVLTEPGDPHTLRADTLKLNSLTTLRGRLGFAWDRTLLYATGGWAWSEFEVTTANSNTGGVGRARIVTDRVTPHGWTVGGGIERSLWSNWTGKIEYQFVHSDAFTFKNVGVGHALSLLT
jgi:outer membrane immunogenic protein